MVYYIDVHNGSDSAPGTCAACPRKSYRDLSLQPGDSVLFKRGSIIREPLVRVSGTPEQPILYGAYGEGMNPVFYGTVDVCQKERWVEISENIWKYTDPSFGEVCNVIFEGGICGTLRWEAALLTAQGDWYDSQFNDTEITNSRQFLLYSVGNPTERFRRIECSVKSQRHISANARCTVCQDLCFIGGVHAMEMGSDHITVRRCSFAHVGGAVWKYSRRIRFGNAIEFWQHGEDILIEDCFFHNIYDSCITHQGPHETCETAKNIVIRGNLFMNYGMGAYEGRDRMSINCSFTQNLCVQAGGGFSAQGDTVPRNSEIYPQPMGHHIFLWRMDKAEEGGCFEISDNVFYGAAGAAIYSIIDKDAEKQLILRNNRYQNDKSSLLNHLGQTSYTTESFSNYAASGWEENPSYGMTAEQLQQAIAEWFARTGAQGPEFYQI